jgi:vacuolar-type H+-ATPase subunit H
MSGVGEGEPTARGEEKVSSPAAIGDVEREADKKRKKSDQEGKQETEAKKTQIREPKRGQGLKLTAAASQRTGKGLEVGLILT